MDTARDELAYELAEEVKAQVDLLTGLNKGVKDLYRMNLFEDVTCRWPDMRQLCAY
jgi:hypothetical protein